MKVDYVLHQTLDRVTSVLEEEGILYAVTGGVLTSIWGDPRNTQDVDIVVVLNQPDRERILKLFGNDFLISEQMLDSALRQGGIVQLLDNRTSVKVDLHVISEPDSSFTRLRREDFPGGVSALVFSKEDAIVSKLRWIRKGSLRSRKDIKGMLLNSRPIDRELLLSLADHFGCKELFLEIEAEDPIQEVE